MNNINNVEQQCFKRVWKNTLKSVLNNPTSSMIMAETNSIQQVKINLKKKRSRRRRKKKKCNNCECCTEGTANITDLISTLNTKGTLFLHCMPCGSQNTVCLNGMQFANINSLKSFLRYFNQLKIKLYFNNTYLFYFPSICCYICVFSKNVKT